MGVTDGMFRTNVAAPVAINSQTIVRVAKLVEVARPYMISLTEQIHWPCDLHLFNRGRMRVLESTHGLTLFGKKTGLQPDAELNVFAAASGLAFLAAKEDGFACDLIEEVKSEQYWSLSRFGISPSRLIRDLHDIRQKGYATRRATQGKFDNRNAIAVAILDNTGSIGAITLSWHRQHATAEVFAAQHLGSLQNAAQAISAHLCAQTKKFAG
jgi:DNA-binding IclR family transcriptional regulator